MSEIEKFEDIQDYASDYANFADGWLMAEKTCFRNQELTDDPEVVHAFRNKLSHYLQENYNDFLEENAPSLFVEFENEKLNNLLSGSSDNDNTENGKIRSTMKTTRQFLIDNKEEIICLATLELEGIIRNYIDTYTVI
jgi:hypothetical protein